MIDFDTTVHQARTCGSQYISLLSLEDWDITLTVRQNHRSTYEPEEEQTLGECMTCFRGRNARIVLYFDELVAEADGSEYVFNRLLRNTILHELIHVVIAAYDEFANYSDAVSNGVAGHDQVAGTFCEILRHDVMKTVKGLLALSVGGNHEWRSKGLLRPFSNTENGQFVSKLLHDKITGDTQQGEDIAETPIVREAVSEVPGQV